MTRILKGTGPWTSARSPLSRVGGFLLDTSVLSEPKKARPDPGVTAFLKKLRPERTFVSALTIGELRKGAALRARRNFSAGEAITLWIDGIEQEYDDRILALDHPIARLWGELNAQRTRAIVDTLLAATAIHHGLTLVTRNTKDVEDTPASLHNPWLD